MKAGSFTNMYFYKVPVCKSYYYELNTILSKNLFTPEQSLLRCLPCSGVNKIGINKYVSSCNTLQKLRVNNSLRIIVGQLNISSIRNKSDALCSIFKQKIDILLVSETKIDGTFPLAQFCVESYSTPYRLDRTCEGGGLLLYVRDVYLQNKLN